MARVILKPGREKSLQRKHPWIFSGAIHSVDGFPQPGETVAILSAKGDYLGWGAYSPTSQIRIRVWTSDMDTEINADFFYRRIKEAVNQRNQFIENRELSARRLVFSESDGIPGLIVDQYKDVLVVQFLSWGVERHRDQLVDILDQIVNPYMIYERSDADVRKLENMEKRVGVLKGDKLPEKLIIIESGCQYFVNIAKGHKTGFYLDQRENRLKIRKYSTDKDVLDCFSYTGGFSISALSGGAKSVTAIDSSSEAIEIGRKNIGQNFSDTNQIKFIEGDVSRILRQFRDRELKFDLIILDPPKFAPTPASIPKAVRGYKDINLLAFKLLAPGGILATFSCSGGINVELFQKIIAGAALDAGVNAKIYEHFFQAPDHPISLTFPEGAYLKGFALGI